MSGEVSAQGPVRPVTPNATEVRQGRHQLSSQLQEALDPAGGEALDRARRALDYNYWDDRHSLLQDIIRDRTSSLDFHSVRLNEKTAEPLVRALGHNSSVTSLELSFNDLGDRVVSLLCTEVLQRHPNLEYLGLKHVGMSNESAKDLLTALQDYNTSVVRLDISENAIEDEALVKAIASQAALNLTSKYLVTGGAA